MAQITLVSSNHLKQQYRQSNPAPGFEIENSGKSIEINRTQTNNAGPAAIVSLSPEAIQLLRMNNK